MAKKDPEENLREDVARRLAQTQLKREELALHREEQEKEKKEGGNWIVFLAIILFIWDIFI